MDINLDVKRFYEEQYDESTRETRTPLEFIRSKQIISRYLNKSSMNIADIARGAGVYSFWLAGLGHKLHLLDLAQNHIDLAKEHSRKTNTPLASYTCADARYLPYKDESMDIVLLMGALYHLQKRDDRLMCLLEAKRVLKTNGILICTVISKYSPLVGYYRHGNIDDINLKLIDETIKTGKYNNLPYFPSAFFHSPDEIISEISDACFSNINLIAVEGFANAFIFESIADDDYKLKQMLRHIEMTETNIELMGMSKNIIAIGTKY